ncbi:hypothetical protein JK386_12390 [Nocardioides sp. zg-536]|uniref:Sulfotransferase family protein n=1 Tax=Nocardioides faecalis TaxID=2803858 RepID=A0A939BTJ1_9ACTN|nr:hypothetical protein [Nocardioides faecalis]MBM9460704.1 hypothetical protein [Nocardioides faecalis]QVI57909.1 hypothetical protein KG111_12765 [Nocardioides faecalis]
MARRVFLHAGLPKTGTTYLQRVLWAHREALLDEGLLLPGFGHREHLWAALEVCERDLARRDPRAAGAWERLCAEATAHPGDVLLSHEFFCAATARQAAAVAERLRPAELHLILTARQPAAMLAAGWQESVKNGGVVSLEELASRTGRRELGWWTLDLGGVLHRWAPVVPADRIHVLVLPGPRAPAEQHWHNLAGVLGLSGDHAPPAQVVNPSLGVAQAELLRRVNAHLDDFRVRDVDRGDWIRDLLAERHLAAQAGTPVRLAPEVLTECRRRARAAVDLLAARGVHVVGDPNELLVPEEDPAERGPHGVSSEELLDAATALVASLLRDLREVTAGRSWRDALGLDPRMPAPAPAPAPAPPPAPVQLRAPGPSEPIG